MCPNGPLDGNCPFGFAGQWEGIRAELLQPLWLYVDVDVAEDHV